MHERQRSWSAVRDWTPCRVQVSSFHALSHWSGQQQHLLQWLQALGAQEMQWAQALDKRPWLQMYTVPGNCTPLGWQNTEGSPGRTWQAWGGSFLLLSRRHALSSRWLWTFNHNTCKNRLEEVQGSATSFLFTTPLFQNTWPCVQLLRAERDLAIDKAKPPASVAKWQGNDLTDLQCQAARLSPPGQMSYLCSLALTIWTSFWRREDSDGMEMWNAPMVQSRQPLTYRLMKAINPHDRRTWRSGVRSAMRAASQLSGRGPTEVGVVLVPAC